MALINGLDIIPQFELRNADEFTILSEISMFAGKNVELTLRTSGTSLGNTVGPPYIDSIGFVAPEPSSVALIAAGGLALVGRWRFYRFCMKRKRTA